MDGDQREAGKRKTIENPQQKQDNTTKKVKVALKEKPLSDKAMRTALIEKLSRDKAEFFRGRTLYLGNPDGSGRDDHRVARRAEFQGGTRPLAEIQEDMEVVSAPVSVALPLSSGLSHAVAGLFAMFV